MQEVAGKAEKQIWVETERKSGAANRSELEKKSGTANRSEKERKSETANRSEKERKSGATNRLEMERKSETVNRSDKERKSGTANRLETEKRQNRLQNEMRLEFDSRSCNEGFARVTVAAFLTQLNPTFEEVADVKTAVSEAVTNAIIHGYEGNVEKIEICCRICGKEFQVEVIDHGKGIANVPLAMEPLFTTKAECDRAGMGFAFMEAFMDSLEVESEVGKGTCVRMTKRIVRERAEPHNRVAQNPREESRGADSQKPREEKRDGTAQNPREESRGADTQNPREESRDGAAQNPREESRDDLAQNLEER